MWREKGQKGIRELSLYRELQRPNYLGWQPTHHLIGLCAGYIQMLLQTYFLLPMRKYKWKETLILVFCMGEVRGAGCGGVGTKGIFPCEGEGLQILIGCWGARPRDLRPTSIMVQPGLKFNVPPTTPSGAKPETKQKTKPF